MKSKKVVESAKDVLKHMTTVEKFWVFTTVTMFLTQKGNKFVTLKLLSFPIFVRMFKEILKSAGMKNVKKIVSEWEWLLYAAFLTIVSVTSFKREPTSVETEPIPVTEPKTSEDIIRDLIRRCERELNPDEESGGEWV